MLAKISFNSRLFGLSFGLTGQLHKIFGISTLHLVLQLRIALLKWQEFLQMNEAGEKENGNR